MNMLGNSRLGDIVPLCRQAKRPCLGHGDKTFDKKKIDHMVSFAGVNKSTDK